MEWLTWNGLIEDVSEFLKDYSRLLQAADNKAIWLDQDTSCSGEGQREIPAHITNFFENPSFSSSFV